MSDHDDVKTEEQVDSNTQAKTDDCSAQQSGPSIGAPLKRYEISRAAGALIKADVNLLATALTNANDADAVMIINDVWEAAKVNLLDSCITDILKDSKIVDRLQSYETVARTYLNHIIKTSYQQHAMNDQQSVIRVRYNKFRMWYGGAITCFACGYMLYITIMDLSYADTVLGFLMGTMVGTVVTFYFGASAKSGDLAEDDTDTRNKTVSSNTVNDEQK